MPADLSPQARRTPASALAATSTHLHPERKIPWQSLLAPVAVPRPLSGATTTPCRPCWSGPACPRFVLSPRAKRPRSPNPLPSFRASFQQPSSLSLKRSKTAAQATPCAAFCCKRRSQLCPATRSQEKSCSAVAVLLKLRCGRDHRASSSFARSHIASESSVKKRKPSTTPSTPEQESGA